MLNHPLFVHALGCQQVGDMPTAMQTYQQLLMQQPTHWPAWVNLGNLHFSSQDYEQAWHAYQQALALGVQDARLWANAGAVLVALQRHELAQRYLYPVVRVMPQVADPWVSLGVACLHLGRLAEARRALAAALALAPQQAAVHFNLARLYDLLGKQAPKCWHLQQALMLEPDKPQHQLLWAMQQLKMGNWQQGWSGFEQRFAVGEGRFRRAEPGLPAVPRWQGQSLVGKRLALLPEQGLGDNIQALRCLTALPEQAQVWVQVPAPLLRLCQQNYVGLSGVKFVSDRHDFPAVDYALPLFSLPAVLDLTAHQLMIWSKTPYLDVPQVPAAGHDALPATTRPKVGLVWRGNPELATDRWRSVELSVLSPLLSVTEVAWVSLQKTADGLSSAERQVLAQYHVQHDADAWQDMADTAQVIRQLDLVIAVDTAVAHLAAAMGKPVWLFNRAGSEWRWGWQQTYTPWYAALRLFNQERLGDWHQTVAQMRQRLLTWFHPAVYERDRI